MRAHLIAVQAAMTLSDYRDAEAFRGKILALTEMAVRELDDAPKLLAFPETIGVPLLLTLGNYDRVSRSRSVGVAALKLARRAWLRGFRLGLRRGVTALYHLRAVPAYLAYCDAFREASRRSGATITAGSTFLPLVEEEAARGVHTVGRAVYNTAYTFGPTGTCLDRTHKLALTPGLESRIGLSRAPAEGVHAFETPVGRVGVAVCLDGFYASVLDRLDGLGAQIVVQPSANHASWERPWPPDPRLREGEAWLRYGLRAGLQDRLHLRYGVNPMMVGDVFDLKPRGRSSLLVNRRFSSLESSGVKTEGYEGVLGIAETSDREEIVRAEVEV